MTRYHDDANVPRFGTLTPGTYLIESRGGAFYLHGVTDPARTVAGYLASTLFSGAYKIVGNDLNAMITDSKTKRVVLVTRMD